MSKVYLLCFSVTVIAANPVFQRIPLQLTQTCPSQTCPTQTVLSQTCPTQTCLPQISPSQTCQISPSQTCQTCLPKTCSTCQPTFSTLPNQIQQTPCQSCQNNQHSILPISLVTRQPNCPCNQPVQNINQPANQDVLNQMVLSKILSPQLQMMLNPNTKACDHCAPKPKTEIVPNIINNYIIIPPEYFKTNETNVTNEEVIRTRERKGRRRTQKPMTNVKNFELDDIVKLFRYVQNSGEIDNSARNNDRFGKQGRQRNKEDDDGNAPCPCEKLDKASTASISSFLNEDKSQIVKFLGNKVNTHNANKNQDILSEKIISIENMPVEATHKRRNPEKLRTFEETIIKEFCKNNPGIPEEIAWSLLMNLKRQVQNLENPHQYSSAYFPLGYQYDPQMFNPNNQARGRTESDTRQKDKRQRRPKPSRFGRRNQNREKHIQGNKKPCDTCDKTVEINPSLINVETETFSTGKISTTTEKKVQETLPKKSSETQIATPYNLIDKLEQIKDKFVKLNEIETTTMNYNKIIETFPELGREDKVPTVYDNGVEYYPDFRGDNVAFIASEEELERYHYTTDRNGVAEGTKHNRYVGLKKHSHDQISATYDTYKIDDISTEYSLPIPTEESTEDSEESINASVEIQFRVPPSLELPDFETKQINKYSASEETDDKFVTDNNKASAYSGVKRTQDNDLKPITVFSKDKKGKTSVETLFGHSKVARYGQDVEEAGSSPVITYYLPEEAITEERIQMPDGDSAVVVAVRSLKEICK